MHYRNGGENPRNIMKVADDGRETAFAVVFDPDDAVGAVAALNSAVDGRGCRCGASAHGPELIGHLIDRSEARR
jgi:hypothetical protein